MSGRVLFTCKPLSLSVVAAALSTLPPAPVGALLLPQKPLALSSSWDCKSTANNDWLCRNSSDADYNQPLEQVTRQRHIQNTQTSTTFQKNSSALTLNAPERYEPDQRTYEATYPSKPAYTPQIAQQPYSQQPILEPVVRPNTIEQRLSTNYFQAAPAPVPAPAPAPVPSAESIGLNRLLNSPHGSYVLQWLAAHTPKPLRDLQNYYPVLQEATIVQYQRNDKYWYVLLDGPFKDRESAMAVLKASPRSSMINKLYPWTRSVASIQKLNLVRPDTITPNSTYERTAMINDYDLPALPRQSTETMFASIAPAYPNIEKTVDYPSIYDQPALDLEYKQPVRPQTYDNNQRSTISSRSVQHYSNQQLHSEGNTNKRASYNRQASTLDYNGLVDRSPANKGLINKEYQQESFNRINNHKQEKINDLLAASPGSYTIQWLAGHNKDTLERTKRRYAYLDDAQIIQYRKRNRNWFVLLSPAYSSLRLVKSALEQPAYARIATRLYPRIRSIDSLRQLTTMSKRTIVSSKMQPGAQPDPIQTMLAGPDSNYTIQWFAANKPEAINKMKQRFPELASAVTVHYRRNQKDWYVLLQGQYDSSREALSIIKSPGMKDAVRILHPWTRPVGSLKKLSIQKS